VLDIWEAESGKRIRGQALPANAAPEHAGWNLHHILLAIEEQKDKGKQVCVGYVEFLVSKGSERIAASSSG
jgi:hypothetical protein